MSMLGLSCSNISGKWEEGAGIDNISLTLPQKTKVIHHINFNCSVLQFNSNSNIKILYYTVLQRFWFTRSHNNIGLSPTDRDFGLLDLIIHKISPTDRDFFSELQW